MVKSSGSTEVTIWKTIGYLGKNKTNNNVISLQIGEKFVGFINIKELRKFLNDKDKNCKIKIPEVR